jgi:hypothetical protein
MIARTYLEPLRIRPLRDVAPLNRGVAFRLPLNAGLTRFWRDQAQEEKRFHAPAFLVLLAGMFGMLATTAWEGVHIQSTLRGAVAVFDRQAPPAPAAFCSASECKAASAGKLKPQRISNPNPAGATSMPSIHLKFGVLLQ